MNAFHLGAISVGGKLLIDAGAQWDTSQVWSDGTKDGTLHSSSEVGGWPWVFDGNLSSYIIADDGTFASIELPSVGGAGSTYKVAGFVQGAAKVRIDFADASFKELSAAAGEIPAGGTQVGWGSLLTAPAAITKITSITDISSRGAIAALEVDGTILVDAGSLSITRSMRTFRSGESAKERPSTSVSRLLMCFSTSSSL